MVDIIAPQGLAWIFSILRPHVWGVGEAGTQVSHKCTACCSVSQALGICVEERGGLSAAS